MATPAHLAGNKRYLAKQENVAVRFKKGSRNKVRDYALSHGYTSLAGYIKALIKADSNIEI